MYLLAASSGGIARMGVCADEGIERVHEMAERHGCGLSWEGCVVRSDASHQWLVSGRLEPHAEIRPASCLFTGGRTGLDQKRSDSSWRSQIRTQSGDADAIMCCAQATPRQPAHRSADRISRHRGGVSLKRGFRPRPIACSSGRRIRRRSAPDPSPVLRSESTRRCRPRVRSERP